MKRIHLFEFADFPWLPHWIRNSITRLINVMHRLRQTPGDIAGLVEKALPHAPQPHIVDLCSGSGGPMPAVFQKLRHKPREQPLQLTLTDLYPSRETANTLNDSSLPNLHYETTPVDATDVSADFQGVRTLIGSFHHMTPAQARQILLSAQEDRVPICVYEMSDNPLPVYLWWISLPIIFWMVFLITPFVRPLKWEQLVFTYLVPVLPFLFAWDGAVSNARTYTLDDMGQLLEGLDDDHYRWETGKITHRGNKLYLLGLPVES